MNISINENLKKLRKQKGNTQEEVAVHLGISMQAVSKWERGESYPDITLLPALALYYNVTADKLLGIEENAINAKIKEYMTKHEVSHKQEKMKEMLQIVNEIQEANPKIAQIVKEVRNIAAQANTLAVSAVDVSEQAGDAGRSFKVVAEEIRTLSIKSEASVAHSADIIEKSAALTDVFNNLIREISDIMAAGAKIQQMSKLTGELQVSSVEMLRIYKIFNDIALQMYLVALNANVEAVRTGGDWGKIFGGIAEKIRDLAQHSQAYAADSVGIIQGNAALVRDLNSMVNELHDVFAWI
jgi:methyl-accepting chemotaxis protein